MQFETIKETPERVYYYTFEGGTSNAPNIDDMVAYLIDQGVLFCGAGWDDCERCITVSINCNDYFYPGADGENVTYEELPDLYELVRAKKFDGVTEFVAKKRGIPNVHWRKKVL